jgi:hypothetical protein
MSMKIFELFNRSAALFRGPLTVFLPASMPWSLSSDIVQAVCTPCVCVHLRVCCACVSSAPAGVSVRASECSRTGRRQFQFHHLFPSGQIPEQEKRQRRAGASVAREEHGCGILGVCRASRCCSGRIFSR